MGAGGYRYGAGRPGWRRKCEYSLPLDVRRLHRKKLLRPGTAFSWRWYQDDEPCGSIWLTAKVLGLQLSYSWTPSDDEPERKSYEVPLEWTPCRYGGSRPWFRCPWCHRRCALLYGLSRDGYFACRVCLRLGYASECEDTLGRLWRKQRKLEAKLAEDGSRPKGMHRSTYERICVKLDAVEEAKDLSFLLGAASILRRTGMTVDELLK